MTFVAILILVVLGIAAVGVIVFAVYSYIRNRFYTVEKTVKATIYLKKQNPEPAGFTVPASLDDYDSNAYYEPNPLWEKFLDLIHYYDWRPKCLEEKYNVIFTVEGKKVELSIPISVYGMIYEGDKGYLTYKGDQFIDFKRVVTKEDPVSRYNYK